MAVGQECQSSRTYDNEWRHVHTSGGSHPPSLPGARPAFRLRRKCIKLVNFHKSDARWKPCWHVYEQGLVRVAPEREAIGCRANDKLTDLACKAGQPEVSPTSSISTRRLY